jgi:translation initiation factor 4B
VAAKQDRKERNASVAKESNKTAAGAEGDQSEESAQKPNFEILRRGENDEGDTDESAEETANGADPGDKATKPQEKVIDPKKTDGGWRKSPNPATEAGPTTQQLDADGWSTVSSSKKDRSRRGGQNTARAIAS